MYSMSLIYTSNHHAQIFQALNVLQVPQLPEAYHHPAMYLFKLAWDGGLGGGGGGGGGLRYHLPLSVC